MRGVKALARWWLLRRLPTDLRSGDICVVPSGDEGYKIVKVLRTDASIVHIALYKNRYSHPPAQVDQVVLTFGSIDDAAGFGITHLPLSRATFAAWLPIRIQHSPVADGELEGYRIWKESNGGTFQ
jgi:hypothetical protein